MKLSVTSKPRLEVIIDRRVRRNPEIERVADALVLAFDNSSRGTRITLHMNQEDYDLLMRRGHSLVARVAILRQAAAAH